MGGGGGGGQASLMEDKTATGFQRSETIVLALPHWIMLCCLPPPPHISSPLPPSLLLFISSPLPPLPPAFSPQRPYVMCYLISKLKMLISLTNTAHYSYCPTLPPCPLTCSGAFLNGPLPPLRPSPRTSSLSSLSPSSFLRRSSSSLQPSLCQVP